MTQCDALGRWAQRKNANGGEFQIYIREINGWMDRGSQLCFIHPSNYYAQGILKPMVVCRFALHLTDSLKIARTEYGAATLPSFVLAACPMIAHLQATYKPHCCTEQYQ